eukprot:m.1306601 g.1306601  ORF g.1306601 m.1306601 type:complete len:527 (-) comp24816_c0_seq2:1700-3280(-)
MIQSVDDCGCAPVYCRRKCLSSTPPSIFRTASHCNARTAHSFLAYPVLLFRHEWELLAIPRSMHGALSDCRRVVELNLWESRNVLLPWDWTSSSQAYTGNLLWVYLQGNQLSTVPNDMLTNFVGSFLFLFLSNNQIETIPPSTFSGFRGSKIALFFDANNVTSIDDVFKDFVVGGVVTLSLVNNSITATSLASALRSFSSSSATLNLDLYGNNVKSLPDNVFAGIGNNTVPGQSPSIHINLMHNPLAALSTNTFQGGWMNDVSVDLSDTTSDTYIIPPYLAWFNRVESLSLNFSGTAQLMLSDLSAFRDFNGRSLSIDMSRNRLTGVVGDVLPQAPFSVYLNLSYNEFTAVGNHSFQFPGGVDLSHNNISVIQNESFWGSRISSLNISSNAITFVDCAAFNYSFALTDLGLSFNHVSMVTHTFLDNVPALNDFRVDNNAVWALPTTSNHLAGPDKAAKNILTCGTYGPAATNCTCAPGLAYSEFCGYGRCMATASGYAVHNAPHMMFGANSLCDAKLLPSPTVCVH